MENSSYIGLKKIRSDSHLEIFLLGLCYTVWETMDLGDIL